MNTENKAPSTLEEEEELLRSIGVAQENAAGTDDTETGTEIQNPYAAAYETALEKLANREPFEYDVNGDAVYQQYKEKAQRSAALGMKDTVAQIAAMNGGYGNSYAQTAGQQVYNSTMQEVDDMIPELYDIALERYNRETEDLQANADAYGDAYGQWEELRAEAEKGEKETEGDTGTGGLVLTASETMNLNETLRGLLELKDYEGMKREIDTFITDEGERKVWYERWGVAENVGSENNVDTNSAAIKDFKDTLMDEKTEYDAIARDMYGPYKAYVAVQIYENAELTDSEKKYLISLYGITEQDIESAEAKGYSFE